MPSDTSCLVCVDRIIDFSWISQAEFWLSAGMSETSRWTHFTGNKAITKHIFPLNAMASKACYAH